MAVWATIAEPKVVTDGEDALPGAGRRAFWFGLIVVLLSLFSGLATYLILTGLTPIQPRNDVVVLVLFFNIVLMVLMVAIIGWQAFGLWRAWQLKIAGARLHVRIVALFSVLAALPVILLATSATITFSRSLDNWFTTRTQAIVGNSLEVAKAYLREHGQVIRTDIVNMAKDLDDAAANLRANQARLQALVLAQAGLRDLPIAYILAADGSVVVKGIDDIKVPYVKPSARAFALADKGQVPLLLPEQTYRVAALVKLENFAGRYLYVARRVNPKVIRQVRLTEQGVADFQRLMRSRSGLKIAHGMMYFMISLTVLLAAIWVGLWFAGRLVAPIRRLIGAAQDVSRGNLRVQLPIRRGEGDLRRLSSTFNHMTSELRSQRDLLVNANAQLTERRRFMEAVLSGVTAGVIGLDRQGQVRLVNRSAERLLASREVDLVDKPLAELVPEFAEVLEPVSDTHDDPGPARAAAKGARAIEQVTMTIDGDERTFALRLTREQSGDDSEGWVVTFDDITELVIAQRTSAWADVARRIAHEIKNPLTPIQLSAERIRRRYGKVLTEDREVFDKCTDT
ncbi:MAG: HAMP domain-containing protein, partial [Pseudomonadota bacterium]